MASPADHDRPRRKSSLSGIPGAGERAELGDVALCIAYVLKTHIVYHHEGEVSGEPQHDRHMLMRFFEESKSDVQSVPSLMYICGTVELLQQTARIEDYALVLATMNLERVLQMWEGSILVQPNAWRMLFLVRRAPRPVPRAPSPVASRRPSSPLCRSPAIRLPAASSSPRSNSTTRRSSTRTLRARCR